MPQKKTIEQIKIELSPYLDSDCVVIEYNGAKKVVLSTKYGKVKSSVSDIKKGYKFTINSAIDKTDYAKRRIKERFPFVDVKGVKNIVNSNSICVLRDKYGELSYTYNDIAINANTKPCIKSSTNKVEYFKNMCIEAHGDKYSYDKTFYKSAKEKVTVYCKKHGDFNIRPYNFINSVFGCPKCVNDSISENMRYSSTGWTLEKWIEKARSSNNFDSFKLYVLFVNDNNESFIKIGRTFYETKKRFWHSRMPYNYEILYQESSNAKYIFDMEISIKSLLKQYKYTPKIKFKGMHECFQIPETEKSIFPFDGHTAHDALERIFKFLKQK